MFTKDIFLVDFGTEFNLIWQGIQAIREIQLLQKWLCVVCVQA